MAKPRPVPPATPVAPGAPQVRECDNCGAPPEPGRAACSYCRKAYPGVQAGIACPRCAAVNIKGQTLCAGCRLELTKPCLFCNQVSPLDAPVCVRCREPFEGAAERMQAREEERKRQEYMKLAGQGMNAAVKVATSPAGEQILGSLMNMLTK